MKTVQEKTIHLLNELIEVHNDRIEGYDRASKEVNDNDLKAIFAEHAATSRQFKTELTAHVTQLGGEIKKGTSASGKIYHTWMDIRSALSTKDRKTVLKSCEFGEDAAISGYKKVIKDSRNLFVDDFQIINRQYDIIKLQHDKIRDLRDLVST